MKDGQPGGWGTPAHKKAWLAERAECIKRLRARGLKPGDPAYDEELAQCGGKHLKGGGGEAGKDGIYLGPEENPDSDQSYIQRQRIPQPDTEPKTEPLVDETPPIKEQVGKLPIKIPTGGPSGYGGDGGTKPGTKPTTQRQRLPTPQPGGAPSLGDALQAENTRNPRNFTPQGGKLTKTRPNYADITRKPTPQPGGAPSLGDALQAENVQNPRNRPPIPRKQPASTGKLTKPTAENAPSYRKPTPRPYGQPSLGTAPTVGQATPQMMNPRGAPSLGTAPTVGRATPQSPQSLGNPEYLNTAPTVGQATPQGNPYGQPSLGTAPTRTGTTPIPRGELKPLGQPYRPPTQSAGRTKPAATSSDSSRAPAARPLNIGGAAARPASAATGRNRPGTVQKPATKRKRPPKGTMTQKKPWRSVSRTPGSRAAGTKVPKQIAQAAAGTGANPLPGSAPDPSMTPAKPRGQGRRRPIQTKGTAQETTDDRDQNKKTSAARYY